MSNNLSPQQLSVFDLETGMSRSGVSPDRPWLLMPWTCLNPSEEETIIRMWSGLKPGTLAEFTISTYRPDHIRMYSELTRFLVEAVEKDQYVTTWNGAFDVAWLFATGLGLLAKRVKWLDGMQLLKRVRSNDFRLREEFGQRRVSFGLKQAAKEFLAIQPYNEGINFYDNSPEMDARMAEYCVKDSIYTYSLTLVLANSLSEREWNNALIESASIVPVAEGWLNGLHIHQNALAALGEKLNGEIEAAVSTLNKIESRDWLSLVSSPARLAALLYTVWGHQPLKFTENGHPSTDKEVLTLLAELDPRVRQLLTLRTALRNKQKFVDTTINALTFLGGTKVHPQCQIYGTYTGRMTVSSNVGKARGVQTGVALHQWKREPEYRNLIVAPPGHIIVELDARGQEFRWMAVASGDEAMLGLCADGEDAHTFMGASIDGSDYRALLSLVEAGDPTAKELRRLGKVANLSCIAEGSPVLTDRGFVPIQDIAIQDKLWDGLEWVSHDGIVFQGVREVMSYDSITATPDHNVFVAGKKVHLDEAARHGWKIESSMGAGWASNTRATVRILDGFIRRAVSAVRRTLGITTPKFLSRRRHRQDRHERPLRAGQFETRHSAGKPRQQATYDILNAGPRTRFSVGTRLVSNCQYRTSANKLRIVAKIQHGVEINEAESAHIHSTYRRTYRGVPRYWTAQIHQARRNGCVWTFGGRKLEILGDWGDSDKAWSMESSAINFPIQGTGADQKYLAIRELRARPFGIPLQFMFDLHDGLYYALNIMAGYPMVFEVLRSLEYVVNNLPYREAWGFVPPVPMPWEIKIGFSWGKLVTFNGSDPDQFRLQLNTLQDEAAQN